MEKDTASNRPLLDPVKQEGNVWVSKRNRTQAEQKRKVIVRFLELLQQITANYGA